MIDLEQEAYYKLSYYTLSHTDPAFIHQYIVDAFAAQNATEKTKPIAVAFGLIGLYLALEKNYTGREVQLAHMKLAKNRKKWPVFELPRERGDIRVTDVLNIEPGRMRDEKIVDWCRSVWESYKNIQEKIRKLTKAELKV